ncbi:MAG: 16S rRNA (uracil(1498)-N(3))-methyltransferase [Geminicoccaceae bacterium]|nr:MAG: 16S rRNA (uracil(1498)-N(3))-methyltransferase [Geminicoccaceae bacterium]
MTDRRIRLFVETPLAAGVACALASPQAHYLVKVMRCRTGDRVRVFDGRSGEWSAVVDVAKREVRVLVDRLERAQVKARGPVLALAPIRRARFEWAVEKATELGMRVLQPVLTERSTDERIKKERLQAIAIEAAEQSERLTVPVIAPPLPLAAWLAARALAVPLYVALERSAAPSLLDAVAAEGPGDLLIGPEGGFGPLDRTHIAHAKAGVAVRLGPTILRAETAAVAGLAVMAMAWDARASSPGAEA